MAIDTGKLHQFLGRFIADLGATIAAGNVVIGHRLGLYQALAAGPARPEDLAARTQTSPRNIAEWLCGQAAGGYIDYDPATGTYSMTEEQAFALADPDGAVYAPGAFVLALGALKAEPRITEAFRTGAGLGWHEQDEDVYLGCEQFFRPGYTANLVPSWIPALHGVEDKLRAGAKVADIGCGLGASTILLALEYPNSAFTGSDYHDRSIEIARRPARRPSSPGTGRSPRTGRRTPRTPGRVRRRAPPTAGQTAAAGPGAGCCGGRGPGRW